MQLLLALIVLLSTWACYLVFQPRPKHPLPPGPTPLPLIGNLLHFHGKAPWKKLTEWGGRYGPIISFKAGCRTFIVLNTREAVHEVLQRRSNVNSSRPRLIAIDYLSGESMIMTQPDTPYYNSVHRVQSTVLNSNTAKGVMGMQEIGAKYFLFRMLEDSSIDLTDHFGLYAVNLSASMMFDTKIGSLSQRESDEQQAWVYHGVNSTRWTYAFIDLFPFLGSIIPGISEKLKRSGNAWFQTMTQYSVSRMENTLVSPTWSIAKAIYQKRPQEMTDEAFQGLVAELHLAFIVTTPMSMRCFVSLALLYPDEFRQVQSEIDQVVGGRLPSFADSGRLVRTNAFMKECLRFMPVLPLGFPHAPNEENTYKGYRIPLGSIVLANQWAINQGNDFEDPSSFKPQRWIDNPDLPSPAAFGYGKRACPGREIGSNNLFILLVYMAWGFNFHGVVDEAPDDASKLFLECGISSVRYTCRSSAHRELIETEWLNADKDPSPFLNRIGDGTRP